MPNRKERIRVVLDTNVLMEIPQPTLRQWERRFSSHNVDLVSPGKRYHFSRDPKDNVFLTIAAAGNADYLVTNDGDLLDIDDKDRRKVRFQIVTTAQFLEQSRAPG